MNKNFIFFDQDKLRLKKLNSLLHGALSLFILLLFFLAFCFFYIPQINPDSSITTGLFNKNVIDEISTRKEDVIEVEGVGHITEIENRNGNNFIVRRPFESAKKVILTFDDGPNPVFTPKILEVLKKENVKAIFFVVGEQLIRYPDLAEKIISDGHLLGVHTYSHDNSDKNLYPYLDNFINKVELEIDLTQKIIISQTGYKTKLFRVPQWGTEDTIDLNTLIFITYADDRDYKILSSTIDSSDWQETDVGKIISNSVNTESSHVILMHDGGGDREKTVSALLSIIKIYKDNGYEFALYDAVDKNDTPLHIKANFYEKLASYITYFLIWLRYNYPSLLKKTLASGLVLVFISSSLITTLAIIDFILGKIKIRKKYNPRVSVIVPAYNEENTIEKTISSILASNYNRIEIIVVDNNSTDRTVNILEKYHDNPKFTLLQEFIQGKYAALNKGILHAKGTVLIMVDADTQLERNSIKSIVQPFADNKIGAVAGNIKVGNVKNFLTVFQQIEYIMSLNLDRRAYNLFATTAVIPGAFGAWRKKAVVEAGLYTNDTLTEDADLAVKIQTLGYKTNYAQNAVAYTEAPDTLEQFLRQRSRWTFGILQVLFKNKEIFFKPQYGILGVILLPYLGIVQLPLMTISPLVDVVSLATIFINYKMVITFFLIFLSIKYVELIIAFILSKEKRIWLFLLLPLMRLFYQILWYLTLYKSIYRAICGNYLPWYKLAHLGTVNLLQNPSKISD